MKSTTKIIIFFICISLIAFKWWHFVKKATSPQPIPKLNLLEQVKEENQKLIKKRAEEREEETKQRKAEQQKEQQEREEQERQREAQKKPISREALNNLIDNLIALEDENNLNKFECTSNENITNILIKQMNFRNEVQKPINEAQKEIDDFNNKIKKVEDKQRPLKSQYDNDTPEFERLQLKDDNDTLTTTETNRYNTLFNKRTQLEIDISKLQHEYEGLQNMKKHAKDLKQSFVNRKKDFISDDKQELLENLQQYYRLQEEEPTQTMS